jgi:hypothetical protein
VSQKKVPLRIVRGRVKLLRLEDVRNWEIKNTTTMTREVSQKLSDHQTSDLFLVGCG